MKMIEIVDAIPGKEKRDKIIKKDDEFSLSCKNTWLAEDNLNNLSDDLITSFWLSHSDLHDVIRIDDDPQDAIRGGSFETECTSGTGCLMQPPSNVQMDTCTDHNQVNGKSHYRKSIKVEDIFGDGYVTPTYGFASKMNIKLTPVYSNDEEKPPGDISLYIINDDVSNDMYSNEDLFDERSIFSCDLCDKVFPNSSNLKIHRRLHTGERPFICDICNKGFTSNSDLKRHQMIHTGERPFKCDVCTKTFNRRSNLKIHQKVHCNAKIYKKRHSYARDIKSLQESHKPFMCDICNTGFSSKYYLKIHSRQHTGDQTYICDICKKGFGSSSDLRRHKMIHTGERPFKCDICSKTFNRSANLRIHKRVHDTTKGFNRKIHDVEQKDCEALNLDIPEFSCENCGDEFLTEFNLMIHERFSCAKQLAYDIGRKEEPTHGSDSERGNMEFDGKTPCKSESVNDSPSYKSEFLNDSPLYESDLLNDSPQLLNDSTNLENHKMLNLQYHLNKNTSAISEQKFPPGLDRKPIPNSLDLSMNKTLHLEDRTFPCDVCRKVFARLSDLKRHLMTHTGLKPYKCDICNKSFTRKSYVRKHKIRHTGVKMYDEKNQNIDNFTGHIKPDPEERAYICDICDEGFSSSYKLSMHKELHIGEKLLMCDFCDKEFESDSDLKAHKMIHIGEYAFQCEICDEPFDSESDLKTHQRMHGDNKICNGDLNTPQGVKSEEGSFMCNICNQVFSTRINLMIHNKFRNCSKSSVDKETSNNFDAINGEMVDMVVKQNFDVINGEMVDTVVKQNFDVINGEMVDTVVKQESEHSYPVVKQESEHSYLFNENTNLKKHFSIPNAIKSSKLGYHNNIDTKENQCDICGKIFSNIYNLKIHRRLHAGGKPYVCDICNKGYSSSWYLKTHKKSHTGEQLFKCDTCFKNFSSASYLTKHKLKHTNANEFANGQNSTGDNLQTPQKNVAEEKPACDICGKVFPSSSNLKIHRRLHTGERPFICDICNKGFMSNSDLKRHRMIHTGEKPWKCEVCNKSFSRKSNLKIHEAIHRDAKLYKRIYTHNRDLKVLRLSNSLERLSNSFSCNICKESFSTSFNLMIHKKSRHSVDKNYISKINSSEGDNYNSDLKIKLIEDTDVVSNTSEIYILDEESNDAFEQEPEIHEYDTDSESEHSEDNYTGRPRISEIYDYNAGFVKHEEIEDTAGRPYISEISDHNVIIKNGQIGDIAARAYRPEISDYNNVGLKREHIDDSASMPYIPKTINCNTDIKSEHIEDTPGRLYRPGINDYNAGLKIEPIDNADIKPYRTELSGKMTMIDTHMHNDSKFHVQGYMSNDNSFEKYQKSSPFCDICGKEFSNIYSLKIHRRLHGGGKPFVCDICNKGYSSSWYLKTHKMTHTGEQLFKCDICLKSFSSNSYLNKHKIKHYSSEIRDQQNAYSTDDNVQTPDSTDGKCVTCDICDKIFPNSSNLKIHRRLHTGERPFICDICNKGFTSNSDLKRHRMIHTGEKPYQCDVCTKAFSRKSNLKSHKRTHMIREMNYNFKYYEYEAATMV